MCGWQVKLCDPLVTHGLYLSALEVQHDKALYKSTFTLLTYFWLIRGCAMGPLEASALGGNMTPQMVKVKVKVKGKRCQHCTNLRFRLARDNTHEVCPAALLHFLVL